MKPYYCVYDTFAPHFAWIFKDKNNSYYHSDWNYTLALPRINKNTDKLTEETPEKLIAHPDTAAKYLVGYYPLNFTTEEFYQQHPELLI